jgi:hypothetical protein
VHEAVNDWRPHGATRGPQPEGGVAPQPPGVAGGNVLRQIAIGFGEWDRWWQADPELRGIIISGGERAEVAKDA